MAPRRGTTPLPGPCLLVWPCLSYSSYMPPHAGPQGAQETLGYSLKRKEESPAAVSW